jgi:hypothetical protein
MANSSGNPNCEPPPNPSKENPAGFNAAFRADVAHRRWFEAS